MTKGFNSVIEKYTVLLKKKYSENFKEDQGKRMDKHWNGRKYMHCFKNWIEITERTDQNWRENQDIKTGKTEIEKSTNGWSRRMLMTLK